MAKIISCKEVGEFDTYDLEVNHQDHQYYLANGVLTSNSHASTYSALSYVMAYLKCKYPTATFVAFFNSHSIRKKKKDERSKLPEFIADAKYFNIEIFPPDINKSKLNTEIEGKNVIRLGIKSISGFRGQAKRLQTVQENRPYASIYDLIRRSGLDAGEIKSLIMCGACDSFIRSREKAISELDIILDLVHKHLAKIKRQEQNLAKYNQGGEYQISKIQAGKKDDTAEKFKKSNEQLQELLNHNLEKDIPKDIPYTPISDEEKAKAEIDLIGICLTINPYAKYDDACKPFISTRIDEVDKGWSVIAGFIQGVTWHLTKAGKTMAYVWLQDYTGAIELTIFPKNIESSRHLLEEGKSILVSGNVNEDGDFLVHDIESAETLAKTGVSEIQNRSKYGRKNEPKQRQSFRARNSRSVYEDNEEGMA